MANFKPLKAYVLQLIDVCIEKRHLTQPFLDVGTGRGDVAEHLAKRGWHGTAIDLSVQAVQIASARLKPYPVRVVYGDLDTVTEKFQTILLLDVLEHVPDDEKLLRDVWARLSPSGALILVVPTNPREWRWDDDYYGHLRRYRSEDLTRLLTGVGFTVQENWDCTFPFFWGLRRLYTALFPKRSAAMDDMHARTLVSSQNSAWDAYERISAIAEHPAIWKPLMRLQWLFRNRSYGSERMVLARRPGIYATPTSE